MNREDIIKWLTELKPAEAEFREYYLSHHQMVPKKQFFDILLKNHGLQNSLSNHFDRINAMQVDPAIISSKFDDTLWLAEKDIISVRQHPRYFPVFKHQHTFIEIAYMFSGTARQTVYFPDGSEETVLLEEGMLLFIPPHTDHTVSIFDDSIMINILIRTNALIYTFTELIGENSLMCDFFAHILYNQTGLNTYLLFSTNGDSRLQEILLDMMIEECLFTDSSQRAIYLLLGLFFTYLQRDYANTMQFSSHMSSGINYIPQILNYIQSHYANTSVPDIAAHFSISTSHLNRMFKQYTNMTIIKTIQKIRIKAACRLLTQTSLSVQEISEAVGYGDVTFFIRIFKQYQQLTPLQYRKHQDTTWKSSPLH